MMVMALCFAMGLVLGERGVQLRNCLLSLSYSQFEGCSWLSDSLLSPSVAIGNQVLQDKITSHAMLFVIHDS